MKSIRSSLSDVSNVSFHLGWINDLPLPDGVYDAVVVHYVFHEIPEVDLPEVLQHLAHKLKPGGRLLVREPEGQNLSIGKLTKLARRAGLSLQYAGASDRALLGEYFDAHFQKPLQEQA
jgi:ubiquinone/menaquinone biosynthesis C-methylase UbiE